MLANRQHIQRATLFFVALDMSPCVATRRVWEKFALLDVLNRPCPRPKYVQQLVFTSGGCGVTRRIFGSIRHQRSYCIASAPILIQINIAICEALRHHGRPEHPDNRRDCDDHLQQQEQFYSHRLPSLLSLTVGWPSRFATCRS